MSIELKIKTKHLTEEAKIIRFEEKKLQKQLQYLKNQHQNTGNNTPFNPWDYEAGRKFFSIKAHRKYDVRNENRASYLARAYLNNIAYKNLEFKRTNERLFCDKILPRVFAMVAKYGNKSVYKNGKYILDPLVESDILIWASVDKDTYNFINRYK